MARTYDMAVKAVRKMTAAHPTHKTARVGKGYRYRCAEDKPCGYEAEVNFLAPKSKVHVLKEGKGKAAHSIKP